jgi:MFS family permease
MALSPAAEPARARRWPAALAWTLAGLAVLSGVPAIVLLSLVWFDGSPEAAPTIATVGPVSLAVLSAAAVGALVASRRPRHPVGWLLLGIGLAVATNVLVEPYVQYGLLVRPGSLPGARHLVGIVYSSFFVGLSCAGFVLLLTPTGSLPSPRWRWWARVAAAAPVLTVLGFVVQPDPLAPEYLGNPLAVPALAPVLLVAGLAGIVVVAVSLPVGAGSLVGRFRRARGVERLQLRWLALAAASASVLLLIALVAGFLGRDPVVLASLALGLALLPMATGAAILRYRLYDLDRIISRTVAYGLLTLVLGLGYAGAVLLLGHLFGGIADRPPSWAVAGATLAVAAVFQPVRRRVQQVVDRRFNRRRHDAARTVEAFAVRLRDQVDLDALNAELLGVVAQTMQPTHASLWLRPPAQAAARRRG